MAATGINSEDRLVQATFAAHLTDALGWESVYAWNDETFGPDGKRDDLNKADRERVKQASRDMLKAIKERLAELDRFWEKEQTKGEIEAFILDEIFVKLPSPPFTAEEKKLVASNVYAHVWQQAMSGGFARAV